jgi:NitT/TauT family transport system permease protein
MAMDIGSQLDLPAPAAVAWPLRRHAAALRRVLLPILFAGALLLAWELALRWFPLPAMILVPPSAIWATLWHSLPILLVHAASTTEETIEGFALGAVIGILLGAAITQSQRVRQALYPNIVLFQLIPKIALAPLFIIWFGVGSPSRLAFALFLSFFPVTISTATGLVGTNRDALRLCASLNASKWQSFIAIRLPFAIPSIFAGLKVGMTMAMIGVIVGEFVTAQRGLGYIIMFASSAAETALVFAALTLLAAVGLALYGCVVLAEAMAQRWYGAPFASEGFL